MLFEIVKLIFPTKIIKYNDRKTLNGKELDVLVVDENIAFEFDGKNFHMSEEELRMDIEKDLLCKKLNINLYRITDSGDFYKYPTKRILEQLTQHGFDVNDIEESVVQNNVTKHYMNMDDINEIISKCTSYKEFCENNENLYRFLLRNNMGHMIDHLRVKKKQTKVTVDEIVNAIQKCDSKIQLRERFPHIYTYI
jgi:hypothetical protein